MDKKMQRLVSYILTADFLAHGGKITQCPPAIAQGASVDPITAAQVAEKRRNWK